MLPIRLPLSSDDYHFYAPSRIRAPHVREAISHTDTTIAFDGYFYLEPCVFRPDRPVKRLMLFQEHMYYIAIHRKTVGADTSVYSPDEEYGGICFFPTELTELHYTVLEVDMSKERRNEIVAEILAEEKDIQEESYAAKSARERAEWEAISRASYGDKPPPWDTPE